MQRELGIVAAYLLDEVLRVLAADERLDDLLYLVVPALMGISWLLSD